MFFDLRGKVKKTKIPYFFSIYWNFSIQLYLRCRRRISS